MSSTGKPAPSAAYPPWQRSKAKQISELLPDVLADVLVRRNGMTLDLIAGWEDIIGPDYCKCTLPEKIVWPQRADDAEPFRPGMLIVACDGPKALFFQHETIQTLERINHFFGFQAIEKIKIVQKPIAAPQKSVRPKKELTTENREKLSDVLSQIDDPDLRKRLEKFGKGVYSRKNDREN